MELFKLTITQVRALKPLFERVAKDELQNKKIGSIILQPLYPSGKVKGQYIPYEYAKKIKEIIEKSSSGDSQ